MKNQQNVADNLVAVAQKVRHTLKTLKDTEEQHVPECCFHACDDAEAAARGEVLPQKYALDLDNVLKKALDQHAVAAGLDWVSKRDNKTGHASSDTVAEYSSTEHTARRWVTVVFATNLLRSAAANLRDGTKYGAMMATGNIIRARRLNAGQWPP